MKGVCPDVSSSLRSDVPAAQVGGSSRPSRIAALLFLLFATLAMLALLGGSARAGRASASFAEQGSLVPTGVTGNAGFGSSLALSGDGATALVGAPGDHAVWVFVRSGTTWTQQAKLPVGGGLGADVALSDNGNTALIGSNDADQNVGAAWVYTRSGTTWKQQAKLTPTGMVDKGWFGESVALASGGNTALIGAPYDSDDAGSAWVFVRTRGKWSQQGSPLVGSGAVQAGADGVQFGWSVALSQGGNNALVGARLDNNPEGAAWVFTRTGTAWAQQAKLTPDDEPYGVAGSYVSSAFGTSASLSSGGNTALIGAANGAWVFKRAGSTWTQQHGRLVPAGRGLGDTYLGQASALAGNGNTALIGDDPLGWVYTRTGTTWTNQSPSLLGPGETATVNPPSPPFAVALSRDGSTVLLSGTVNGVQSVWAFT